MCNKGVDNYAYALGSVPDCSKSQKTCNKAVCTYASAIQFVPDRFKTEEKCDKVISEKPLC